MEMGRLAGLLALRLHGESGLELLSSSPYQRRRKPEKNGPTRSVTDHARFVRPSPLITPGIFRQSPDPFCPRSLLCALSVVPKDTNKVRRACLVRAIIPRGLGVAIIGGKPNDQRYRASAQSRAPARRRG